MRKLDEKETNAVAGGPTIIIDKRVDEGVPPRPADSTSNASTPSGG
jgi:hypothetical protein